MRFRISSTFPQKSFYIFRHGETFATKYKRGYGFKIFSAPILEEGFPALERIGQFLKNKPTECNYMSPILRCRQTVDIVGKGAGKQFEKDSRLREFFLETFWQFRSRVESFLKEQEKSECRNIAICTHSAVISGLMAYILRGKITLRDFSYMVKPGVLVVIENNTYEELDFN